MSFYRRSKIGGWGTLAKMESGEIEVSRTDFSETAHFYWRCTDLVYARWHGPFDDEIAAALDAESHIEKSLDSGNLPLFDA